jgi:sugar-specific transcriptional regulator TrmB
LEPQFSELRVLMDLGLTLVQAKVYWALVKSGPSRTSAISKRSKVHQPDIYKTLSKLQELGLVQQIIKKPREYIATPANKALLLLLEAKTEQYRKVRAETRLLLDDVRTKSINRVSQLDVPQFVLIPKGRIIIERIDTAIAQAQLSINLVISWKRFSHGIASDFAESIENAWAKKVKTRFIVESPPKSETAKQLVQFCRKKPFCQMRFIRNHPAIVLGVYDEKEVFIVVDPKTDLPGSPALWSKNHSLITLAKDYFKILWLTAMEKTQLQNQRTSKRL